MSEMTAAIGLNAQTTLSQFVAEKLSEYTLPFWIENPPAVILDAEDVTASIPCWAVYHLPVGIDNTFAGGIVGEGGQSGGREMGLLEVSVWVTRQMNTWLALQRYMTDLVKSIFTLKENRQVIIRDYASDFVEPPITQHKIDIGEITQVATDPDTDNPALERARILIEYTYTFRAG